MPDVAQPAAKVAESHEVAHDNLWRDCGEAFLQSAVQKPVTGVLQIVDKFAGTDYAKQAQFVPEPTAQSFGKPAWFLEQIASGAGAAIPFLATALAARPLANLAVGEPLLATGMSATRVAGSVALAETTTAGFATGFIFTPSQNGNNFWSERALNGATSAVSMASLHLLSNGLGKFTGAADLHAGIGLKALNTGLAGAGAGIVGAETQSLFTTGKFANGQDVFQSALGMGVTGGVLGAAGDSFLRLNRAKSNLPTIEEFVARQYQGVDANEHYLGEQARKSIFDWPRIARAAIKDKFNQADASEDGPNKAWDSGRANLKWQDWSKIDRINLIAKLERDANSELVNPEVLSRFISRMQEISKRWQQDNIEELDQRAEAAQKEYLRKCDAFNEYENQIYASAQDKQWQDKKGYHRGPDKADQKLIADAREQLGRDRQVRDSEYENLRVVLDRRATEIQQAVNDTLDAEGLPRARVQSSSFMAGAKASYGMGQLNVWDGIIKSPTVQNETIASVLHELIHLEQNNLEIRLLADRIGIGKTASPEEIDTIVLDLLKVSEPSIKEFPAGSEKELAPMQEFVRRAVDLRNGEELSPAEAKRASNMLDGHRTYQPPGKKDADALMQVILNIENDQNNDDTHSLLRTLSEDPQRFGFSQVPSELAAYAERAASEDPENWQDPDWITDSVSKQVDDVLAKQQKKLETQMDKHGLRDYRWYMNNALEQEAYPGGLLAFLMAQANDYAASKPFLQH